jgi:RPA family protein
MEKMKDFSRQTAVKMTIGSLLSLNYVEQKDNEPNYLESSSGEKIYRLNLMGVVLDVEKVGAITNFLVDDGSGKIILRFFEENKQISLLSIGDSILIIGKLRRYNQDKYVSPEIIKKVDPSWLKLRALEFPVTEKSKQPEEKPLDENFSEELVKNKEIIKDNLEVKTEEEVLEIPLIPEEESEIIEESPLLPVERLIKIIKEMDSGEGVLIEEVISNSQIKDTEEILEKMLEKGDIFQNSPGRIKVL